MCSHNKKTKLFCLYEDCKQTQSWGCLQCMKIYHNHTKGDPFVNQQNLLQLLKKFTLPEKIKNQRKAVIVRQFRLLTQLKSQVSQKLDSLIIDIMSRLKYPFLYNQQILEVFRCFRDKKYSNLTAAKVRKFYTISMTVRPDQFLTSEEQHYKQFICGAESNVNDFREKIRKLEKVLNFKITKESEKLHEEFISEVRTTVLKYGKFLESSLLQKSDFMNSNQIKDSQSMSESVKLEKTSFQIAKNAFSIKQMSPKVHHKRSVSINIKQDDKSSKKSEQGNSISGMTDLFKSFQLENSNLKEQGNFNNSMRRSIDVKMSQKLMTGELFQTKTVASYETPEKKSGQGLLKPPDLSQKNKKYQGHVPGEKQQYSQCSFSIKISDPSNKKQNKQDQYKQDQELISTQFQKESRRRSLTKYMSQKLSNPPFIQFCEETKYQQSIINKKQTVFVHSKQNKQKKENITVMEMIKEREDNVKKRLTDMIKFKQGQDQNKGVVNKDNRPTSEKYKQKLKEVMTVTSKINEEETKQKIQQNATNTHKYKQKDKDLTKEESKQHHVHYLTVHNRQHGRKDSQFNDSLSRQIIRDTSKSKEHDDHPKLISGAMKKEIPYSDSNNSSKKEVRNSSEKKQTKTEDVYQEQEIFAGALFIAGINQTNNQNKLHFTEKFLIKHQNCLTAAQYLSFILLEQGKLKQCYAITHKYLQRLNRSGVTDKQKINLMVNQSAALNQMGRYSQTIALLQSKHEKLINDKIHKNIADAYHNIGMDDKAIYHYQKSIRINPKFEQAYYNLAVVLFLSQSYFNAKMNIDKAISLNKINQNYTQLLNYIDKKINFHSVV